MTTTTTVSRAAHGSLRAPVSSQRECLGECFNAPLQARKASAPIPADAAVPMGPMQPARHVASATSKGTVTTVFPHSRTLGFAVSFPMDHVVSHDRQVSREDELREATCAATPDPCTSRPIVVGRTVFPVGSFRGDGCPGEFNPRVGSDYSKADFSFEQRAAAVPDPAPLPRKASSLLGSLPQLGEEHPEPRDLVLLPIEQRTTVPPAALRFVPEGTPRSWVLAAVRDLESIAEY